MRKTSKTGNAINITEQQMCSLANQNLRWNPLCAFPVCLTGFTVSSSPTWMSEFIHTCSVVLDHLAGGVMRVTTSCCPLPLHYQANIFTTAAIWPFSGSDKKKKSCCSAANVWKHRWDVTFSLRTTRSTETNSHNAISASYCELLWLSVRCFLCCLVKSADTPRTPDAQIKSRLRPFHQGAASRARFTHHPLTY